MDHTKSTWDNRKHKSYYNQMNHDFCTIGTLEMAGSEGCAEELWNSCLETLPDPGCITAFTTFPGYL